MKRLIWMIGVMLMLVLPDSSLAVTAKTTVAISDTVFATPTAKLELPLSPQGVMPVVEKFQTTRRGDAYIIIEPAPVEFACLGKTGDVEYLCQLESAITVGVKLKGGLIQLGIPEHYIFVKPTVVDDWESEVRVFVMERYMVEEMGVPLPPEDRDTDDDGTPDWIDDCITVNGSAFNNGCPTPEKVIVIQRGEDTSTLSIPSIPTPRSSPEPMPDLEGPANIQDLVDEAMKEALTNDNGVWFDIGWKAFGGEVSGYYERCHGPATPDKHLTEACWRLDAGVREDTPMLGIGIVFKWEWDGPKKDRRKKD